MNRVVLLILCAIGARAQVRHLVNVNARCVGSIFHSRWILTSASCPLVSQTSIAVGDAYYGIEAVIRYPSYVENYPNDDIALIRLTSNLAFSNAVAPIVLNLNDYNDYRGLTLYVGNTAFRIIEDSSCSVYTSEYYKLTCSIPSSSLATVCPIPTGSPITWNNQLVGLEVGTNQCNAVAPHMFTRVSKYSDWLLRQLAIYGDQILSAKR